MKKLLCLLLLFCLIGCKKQEKVIIPVTEDDINNVDYSNAKELDIALHSNSYLLINLSELKVLYAKNNDKKIYPASLTKVLTMDVVLEHCALNDTSSLSEEEMDELIDNDASIAYLQTDYDYTVEDLLYALILPSGADGAKALENYFIDNDLNLVDEMNKKITTLGLKQSHFVNTTGLHDDDHYTTLDDMLLIVLDTLDKAEARKILKTFRTKLSDGTIVSSTLISTQNEYVTVLGGKTGTTDEAGQLMMSFFTNNNRSYMLITADALGHGYKEYYHFEDAITIYKYLFID